VRATVPAGSIESQASGEVLVARAPAASSIAPEAEPRKRSDPPPAYDQSMALRLAQLSAIAAAALGIIAIPVIMTMPSPVMLCKLRPPFEECTVGQLTGAQYVTGDSPAAAVWLVVSLVIAPLTSLLAVWLVGRGSIWRGRIVAVVALVPNLPLFTGSYALMPFHPLVFALTFIAAVSLVLSDRRMTATTQGDVEKTRRFAILAAVLGILVAGVALLYAVRVQAPPTTAPTATLTVRLGSEASACGRLTDYAVSPTSLNPTERVLTLELRSVNQTTNAFRYRLAGNGTTPSDLGTQFSAGTPQVLFVRGWFAPPSPATPREVTVTDYSVTRTTEPCPVTQ